VAIRIVTFSSGIPAFSITSTRGGIKIEYGVGLVISLTMITSFLGFRAINISKRGSVPSGCASALSTALRALPSVLLVLGSTTLRILDGSKSNGRDPSPYFSSKCIMTALYSNRFLYNRMPIIEGLS